MGQFGIGQSVKRTEDLRFLSGHGRYMDDINRPRRVRAMPSSSARPTLML